MNLLVCCEESQAVCKAFLEYGVNAFSCDLQASSGGRPDRHIIEDCLKLIEVGKGLWFQTEDGYVHFVEKWDMIIAHPPCTYLSNVGNRVLYDSPGVINQDRYEKGIAARDFFMKIWNAPCYRVVVENPVPASVFNLPKYSQIVCPSQFGSDYKKRTCLWERGVPPLMQTCYTLNAKPTSKAAWFRYGNTKQRQINRSKTDPFLARAMAHQWSY